MTDNPADHKLKIGEHTIIDTCGHPNIRTWKVRVEGGWIYHSTIWPWPTSYGGSGLFSKTVHNHSYNLTSIFIPEKEQK